MTSTRPSRTIGNRTPKSTEVRFNHSDCSRRSSQEAGCSLLVSTYQAGKLVAVGIADGQLAFSFRSFERAMGVAVGADRIAVAGRSRSGSARPPELAAASSRPAATTPASCLAPPTSPARSRATRWPGARRQRRAELWLVNTLFSCLAARPATASCRAGGRRSSPAGGGGPLPPQRPGDARRSPAFVTVLAATDTPSGWRTDATTAAPDRRRHRRAGHQRPRHAALAALARRDLCARLRHGAARAVDPATGRVRRSRPCPATRAAWRSTAAWPSSACRGSARPRCSAACRSRRPRPAEVRRRRRRAQHRHTLATLEFDTGVEEIFDVQVLPGTRCPSLGGSSDGAGDYRCCPAGAGLGAPKS